MAHLQIYIVRLIESVTGKTSKAVYNDVYILQYLMLMIFFNSISCLF
jgi:hypothetical protein